MGFGELANHSVGLMNTGAVMYGGGEMLAGGLGRNSGQIAEAFGIEASQATSRLAGAGKLLGAWGKNLGVAGVALTSFNIGNKLLNNEHVSGAEYTNLGISAGLVIGAAIAGTAAAPFIAVASLIYGGLQLGSYLFTGNTLEENILGK